MKMRKYIVKFEYVVKGKADVYARNKEEAEEAARYKYNDLYELIDDAGEYYDEDKIDIIDVTKG